MPRSAAVERWFAATKPPRVRYGVTLSSSKSGDFAAFVRYREPGVNLRLHRGDRLRGRYPHLEGAVVKRMRIADEQEASARAGEISAMVAMVREWCALGARAISRSASSDR